MSHRNIQITLFGNSGQIYNVCVDAQQERDLRGLLTLIRDAELQDDGDDWKGGARIPRMVCIASVAGEEVWIAVRSIQSVIFGRVLNPTQPS